MRLVYTSDIRVVCCAVKIARRNAAAFNLSAPRCAAYCGDMFAALPQDTLPFNVILFNPPQVHSATRSCARAYSRRA